MESCEGIPDASAALRLRACSRGAEKDAGSSVNLSPSVSTEDAVDAAITNNFFSY